MAADPASCHLCGFVPVRAANLIRHVNTKKCQENLRKRNATTRSTQQPLQPHVLPSLEELLNGRRGNVKLLQRVPNGARQCAADALAGCLDSCVSSNSLESFTALLDFSYRVLCVPWKRPKKGPSLAAIVRQNLQNRQGTFQPEPRPSGGKPNASAELRKRVEVKIQLGDISGAVRVLVSEEAIAPLTPDTLAILKEKHPEPPADFTAPSAPTSAVDPFTIEEVKAAVESFSRSAAGPDGLSPQHVKDLINGTYAGATRLTESLTAFCNHLLQGKLPPEVCRVLYGASLTPLKKKDGGIRPIAVGCTLRRLVCKVISRRVRDDMGNLLRPQQLGFGTKAGAEAAVHATRVFLQEREDLPTALVKLDFKNAFNTVRRDILMERVKQHLPDYFPFVSQMYSATTALLCNGSVIESRTGVQQGDPLGPLLFCLIVHELSTALQSSLNLWYLDDVTIGGDLCSVINDLRVVEAEAKKYGLQLNLSKCEAWVQGRDKDTNEVSLRNTYPELEFPTAEELTLLGAPLTEASIEPAILEKTRQAQTLTSKLSALPKHQALFLLRNCLSLPKLMYILRCSEAWKFPAALQSFDEVIRNATQQITNVRMADNVWLQASMPSRLGGLGLRTAASVALPAYLSSLYLVRGLVESMIPDIDYDLFVADGTAKWMMESGTDPPDPAQAKFQLSWDKPLLAKRHDRFVRNADVDSKSRLLASSTKESAAWLGALPSSVLGTLLDDDATTIAVALRLGADICEEHRCRCGTTVDRLGHHGLSCKFSAGRRSRHSCLNETIKRALGSAAVPSILEPTNLCRADGKHPDGKTELMWTNGKSLVWDVTCVDTVCRSYVSRTSESAGAAANDAEERKLKKYEELSDRYIVQPVGFETFGSWGDGAKHFIKSIGRRIKDRTGNQNATRYLRERISLDIQWGNAACVLGTTEVARNLDEIFSLLNVNGTKIPACGTC